MANEAEYAHYTGQIATAVIEAHATLRSVTHALGDEEIGRMLDRRSEDVATLKPGVRSLAAAEQTVQRAEGAAEAPARDSMVRTLATYQGEVEAQSARIGTVQRELGNQRTGTSQQDRHTLQASSQALTSALGNLERIEHMPDRATDDLAKLRSGVEYLKKVVDDVDNRVERMTGQLSEGRQAAYRFHTASPRELEASADLGRTIGRMQDSIADTRDHASRLHDALAKNSQGFESVAKFSVEVANGALAEQQHADLEAKQLADAVRAGVNPTARADQHPVAQHAESDLSRRLNGPAHEGGLNL
jgi:chromosome segregation ATPase